MRVNVPVEPFAMAQRSDLFPAGNRHENKLFLYEERKRFTLSRKTLVIY